MDEIFAATPEARMRYAVFPSFSTGLAAILPVVRVINEGNGGRLSMATALKIYYAGRGEPVKSYVDDIRKFMMESIRTEAPSLSDKRVKEVANEILARRVSKFTGMDDDFSFVAQGLIRKEGLSNPPGIEYRCAAGFSPNLRNLYSQEQFDAITAFKARHESTLRKILGC